MNVTAALLETLFDIRVKRGHFSRACRSRLGSKYSGKLSTFSALATPYLCVATAACPRDLIKAYIPVIVGGKVFTALIDSGSFGSYIHSSICSKLNLTLYPLSHKVRMTSTSVKVKSLGFCLCDIVVKGCKHALTRLNVLPTLCCDIILGLDFQSQRQRVIFELGGNLQDIVVSHDNLRGCCS